MKKLAIGLVLFATSFSLFLTTAVAAEREMDFIYYQPGSGILACCNGGDLAIGGEYSCPQPDGGHTFNIKSLHKVVNGVSCWKVTCAAINDPPPSYIGAVCLHQECQNVNDTCFVDP